jgi:hypothetical protein
MVLFDYINSQLHSKFTQEKESKQWITAPEPHEKFGVKNVWQFSVLCKSQEFPKII